MCFNTLTSRSKLCCSYMTIWVTWRVILLETGTVTSSRPTLVHLRFFVGVRVAHLFSYLCCVLVLFAFAVCLVLHVTCVSGLFVLDCPFRISTRFIYYRVLVTGRVVNVVGLSPWRYLQTQTYAWPVLPYWVSLSRFSWGGCWKWP